MLKKSKKPIVYMACRKDEAGFTFLSMLLVIGLLAVSLPFIAYLIKSAGFHSNYEELTAQQFFKFLRDETMSAVDYNVSSNTLYLTLNSGKIATIEKYEEERIQARRQVDGKGHEIYLMDIMDLKFKKVPYGFRTTVITKQGVPYEKTIIFYQ
ncbi:hypothetical protein CIL03_02260 [Virgibacillus indicus]|uniref:Competence protein ComGF n=1 Tax=Virgibacillus indicus TaxID=2024554 RepID=A0A265NEU6_9BACI|nr:ComGF family competence protein [Virgibacillus indicus]OZU89979.1 hypothetical protein CIL03_02260 [Virgibacillus indicus]